MTADELRALLIERGALLEGHFRLSSGRHSDRFIQKFRILEDPVLVERIAVDIAKHAQRFRPTIVVSAAVGGIVLGYETARQLGTKAIFVEKEDGVPILRRGFEIAPDDRALIVEDIVTTGGSIREVIDVVRERGVEPAAVGIIVRREPVEFSVPSFALLDLPVVSYEPDRCPQCAANIAITSPGSRFLAERPTA